MSQALFLAALYVYGFWLSFAFRAAWPRAIRAASALVIGMISWVIVGVLLLSFHLPFALPEIAGFALGGAAVAFLAGAPARIRRELPAFAIGLGAVLGVATLFSFWNASMVGDDSFFMVRVGQMIGQAHGLTATVRPQLSAWGILLPLLQSASAYVTSDYLWALQPTLAVDFWILFALLADHALRAVVPDLPAGTRHFLVAGAVLLPVTSTLGAFELVFIHNNFAAGACYFLFTASAFFTLRGEKGWAGAAWFGLLGYLLSRNEAAGMAAPSVLLYLSDEVFDNPAGRRTRLKFLGGLITVTGLWFFTQLRSVGDGASYLGPARIAVMFVPYAGMLLVYLLEPVFSWPARLLSMSKKWLLPAVALVALAMVAFDHEGMGISADAVLSNFFFLGFWGMIWVLAIPVFLLNAFTERVRADHFLRQSILFYLMGWFVMPFRQGWYRAGWFDSGNRNLTHILPTLLLFLIVAYAAERSPRAV